ncbi:hypothetical protein [Jiella sonneratiae]|uniref:Uncharacterized protein n=1 Tax=Jiella sonneratiae TaxID=2816856 RepID=A0ABS3J2C1_9HYPH|nr:hypothetical protein [Jiella sonneratiae]MBO0903819.1 hypothetical protein [Jiella sonneratiae]
MNNVPLGPAGEAAPLRWQHAHPKEAEAFGQMTTAELVAVANGLHEARLSIGGIVNQPRISHSDAATSFFDDEFDRLAELYEMTIEELRRRPSSGDRSVDQDRLRIVATYDLLDAGGSILDVIAYLAAGLEALPNGDAS